MSALKKTLALTPGDPDGIGPEITWKMIRSKNLEKGITLLCVGAEAPFKKLGAPIERFDEKNPSHTPPKSRYPFVWLLPAPESVETGRLLEGFQTGWSIEKATQLVRSQIASALVTGPISKERLQKGGYIYPGHTEFLASLCQSSGIIPPVTMMLANQQLRVSLVTTHIAHQKVSSSLTADKIVRAIQQTADGLTQFWGIQKPKIAVAALNPHAGESGLFGYEEINTIYPAILSAQNLPSQSFEVSGPYAADTLFANHLLAKSKKRYDAIVCMYHDQGLIPVKLLDFHNTVNVTLGLPMIRTSVDHGVGFDIAGKGVANPSSLCAAVKLATYFIQK